MVGEVPVTSLLLFTLYRSAAKNLSHIANPWKISSLLIHITANSQKDHTHLFIHY